MASSPTFVPRSKADFVQTSRPQGEDRRPEFFDISSAYTDAVGAVINDNGADLGSTAAAAKALVRQYWMHFLPQVRNGLLSQLARLMSSAEWDEEDQLPSLDSLRTLLRAIIQIQPSVRPYLGVSNQGYFIAGWSIEGAKFVIDAKVNDRIGWLLATPDGEEINRASGHTNVKEIAQILDAHHGREIVNG